MAGKLLFSSFVSLGAICVAMADPANTSNTFPSDGYMQEDYTYTGAATANNMDNTYEGEVDADPYYTDDLYQVLAGTYLPADGIEVVDCPAGSYCPGLSESVIYNATTAQGISQCPTGYPNSAVGATADTQCYTACSISNFAHAQSVSGNDYYGAGVDTCEISACEMGWHIRGAIPDLTDLIGLTGAGNASAYIKNDGTGSANAATYGLTSNDKNAFVVDYGTRGRVKGTGRCSTQSGTNNNSTWSNPSIQSSLTDEAGTGKYCWCKLDGYAPSGGNISEFSAPWIFNFSNTNATDCMDYCADYCSSSLRNSFASALAFRTAIFNTVVASPAACEANTIIINWRGASAADININNAAETQYGGDVRTPRAAEQIRGKTFRGWKFKKRTQ